MTEFTFDRQNGQLYVGTAAYEHALESGLVDPRDTEDLVAVLTEDARELVHDEWDKLDVGTWDAEDYKLPGQWILEIANKSESGPPTPVTHNQLFILYNRGLGPSVERTKRRFGGTMAGYNTALGPVSGRQRGKYADWTFRQIVDHAAQLKKQKGDWPTGADFQAAYEAGEGPSLTWIERQTQVTKVLERLGLWSSSGKTKEDLLDWGVQVMKANPDLLLSTPLIDCLSAKGMGPSRAAIVSKSRFGSFGNFQLQAEDELRRFDKQTEERNTQVIADAKDIIQTLDLEIDPDSLSATGAARIILCEALGLSFANRQLDFFETASAKMFDSRVLKGSGEDQARIETVALIKDLDRLIWPMDYSHLAVEPDELARFQGRAGKKAKKRPSVT